MGALDRAIKESIAIKEDTARSVHRLASKVSLKVVGGVFKIKSSGSKDGGFLSMKGDRGVTRDVEVGRRGSKTYLGHGSQKTL